MNEYTARESTILGILRNQYAMFAKNEQPMTAYNYSAIDWDELTALAIGAPEYVAYIPPNPKGNPMYETGKHVILPAIMQLPENFGKVKETEPTPVTENLKAPFPRYTVGQHVIAYSRDGLITQIRQHEGNNEYVFDGSFPSNAWFAEDELTAYEAPIEVEALHNRITELTQAIEKALTKLDSYDGLYPSVKAAQAILQAAIQTPEAASADLQKGTLVLTIGEKKPSTARIERIHEDNVGKVYKVRYLSGILGQTWWEAKDLQALAGDTALS